MFRSARSRGGRVPRRRTSRSAFSVLEERAVMLAINPRKLSITSDVLLHTAGHQGKAVFLPGQERGRSTASSPRRTGRLAAASCCSSRGPGRGRKWRGTAPQKGPQRPLPCFRLAGTLSTQGHAVDWVGNTVPHFRQLAWRPYCTRVVVAAPVIATNCRRVRLA